MRYAKIDSGLVSAAESFKEFIETKQNTISELNKVIINYRKKQSSSPRREGLEV